MAGRPRGESGGWKRVLIFLPLLLLLIGATVYHAPPAGTGDEAGYLGYAERITHGGYTGSGDAYNYLWYGPGLPLVLAPLVALGASLETVRIIGPVALFGAVLAFDALLRLRLSGRVAAIGGYALGLYPPFIIDLLQKTGSETLSLLSVTVGLLFAAKALSSGTPKHYLLAALGFAWLAVTRVAFGWILVILVAIFTVLWLVGRSRSPDASQVARRTAIVFALALALCVPWLAYTYDQTHRVMYWSNSGGLNLYWIASPYPHDLGDWQGTGQPLSSVSRLRPEHEPYFRSLEGLAPVARDVALQRKGLELIRQHPLEYVKNVPPNVSRLLFERPFTNEPPLTPSVREAAVYAVPNALILFLLAACVPTLLRKRGRLPPETVPFLAFATLAFIFHSLLAAEARMMVPMLPVLLWVAIYAVSALDAVPLPERIGKAVRLGPMRADADEEAHRAVG